MLIERTGTEGMYWGVGPEGSKPLYQWIDSIDLDKWSILIEDPVAVRNFVTQYTNYTSDFSQFGTLELWQDPRLILHSRNDDCEGLNMLACNILFTLGYDCRIAIGRYDHYNSNLKPEERHVNHAYGLLFTNDYYDTNPRIVECTGDDLVEELPYIDDSDEYYTWYMGSGVYQCNYICNHLVT